MVFQSRVIEISAASEQMKSESFLRGAVDAVATEHAAWQVSYGLHMRCVALSAGAELGGGTLAKTKDQYNGLPHQEELLTGKLFLSFPSLVMIRNGSSFRLALF